MTDKQKLLETLLPFAVYGEEIISNPFSQQIPNDARMFGMSAAPTKEDLINAAKVYKELGGKLKPPNSCKEKPRRL